MALPLFNVKFILLISASFIAIFSSIAIYFCLPILISHILRSQLTLSPSSGSFNDWKVNSVIDRIYLYNVTNLNDLMSQNSDLSFNKTTKLSHAKPIIKLQQIGPFTFRQDREKLNVKFETINETVIYDQKKSWTFLPELSVLKSIDEMNATWIEHINVPLAGTTLNSEYAEFIDPIIEEHDLRLFLNHSVNSLLFEGYNDILMEQAKATGRLDVDRFGWMHNQNNSITKDLRVFTGTSNATLNKFGSIDQFQFKKRFSIWHNNGSDPSDFRNVQCNEFSFSSAGEFYPPSEYSIISYNNRYNNNPSNHLITNHINGARNRDNYNNSPTEAKFGSDSEKHLDLNSATQMARHLSLIESPPYTNDGLSNSKKLTKLEQKIDQTISLFFPDLCRSISLFYNGSYHFKDLLVDRYVVNESTFDYTSDKFGDSNKCFCVYNETTKSLSCPPNGMMDLFSCQKGSPVAISLPHFLHSNNDKSLAPYLRLFQEDIKPDLDEHQFFIDLESTLNVPINVQVVFQFNVHFKNEPALNFTKEYSFLFEDPETKTLLKDIYLPQMWIKSTAEASEKDLQNLRFVQKRLNLITPITSIVMFAFASVLLLASAKLAYDLTYGPRSRKRLAKCPIE